MSTDEMWDWVADGLLPTLSGTPDRPGFVNGFNKVVGQVQIRQRRADLGSCEKVPRSLDGYFRAECRKASTFSGRFGIAENASMPDAAFVGGGGLNFGRLEAGFTDRYFAFLDVENHTQGMRRARELEGQEWLDEATDWTEIHVALFNGEIGAFTHVIVHMEFNEGGLVAKDLDVRPLHIPNWTTALLILDIFWAFLVCVLLLGNIEEARERDNPEGKAVQGWGRRCCGEPWLVLDWGGMIVGTAILVFFFFLWTGIGVVSDQISELGEVAPMPSVNAGAQELLAYGEAARSYENALSVILEELRAAVVLKSWHRISMFWYMGFIMMRFFRGFLGQPQIALIGLTVASALTDIFHLGMVLAVLFENFVMGGYLIFGSEIEEWSTVNKAHMNTLAMFCGQGDFSAMYDLYPVSAVIWLGCFTIALVFIASNMLIAIMVDHFTDVKADMGQGG